jgi:phosphatidate cytidylyltransferase
VNQYLNRVITGAVLFVAAFLLTYFSSLVTTLLVLVLSFLTIYEFKSLSNKMGIYPVANWIYFFSATFILLPLLVPKNHPVSTVYVCQLSIILSAYIVIFSRILLNTAVTKFEDITASLWATFHLGLLPSFFVWLRILDSGFAYFFTIVMAISANDVGCLLFGKLFGKTKLAPQISPGKTVAGSIGGIFCGALAFLGSAQIFNFELREDLWFLKTDLIKSVFSILGPDLFFIILVLVLGILLAIVAQIGDLLVSVLKRAAGVKDSSKILLSHGGVLDRVDSHFFAAWLAFFIFSYFLR